MIIDKPRRCVAFLFPPILMAAEMIATRCSMGR
jgi:hypothetical protein